MSKQALVVVDVQRDFCEGGSLEVKGGNAVAEKIAVMMADPKWDRIILSKDNHVHGSDNGGHISDTPDYVNTWPAHCEQGTLGNLFHPAVRKASWEQLNRVTVIYKGEGMPAYSVFDGSNLEGMSTDDILKAYEITDLTVVGIATDYCVAATAIDGKLHKYNVHLPLDHTAAVADDTAKAAIHTLRRQGVHIL